MPCDRLLIRLQCLTPQAATLGLRGCVCHCMSLLCMSLGLRGCVCHCVSASLLEHCEHPSPPVPQEDTIPVLTCMLGDSYRAANESPSVEASNSFIPRDTNFKSQAVRVEQMEK